MTRSYGIRIPTGVAGYPDKSSSSLHNSVPGTIDQVAVQDVYDQSVDVPLFVKSASITMDRTWSPYCQASLVCVQPSAAQLALIDPRTGMRARFQLTATVDDVAVAPQYFDLGIRSTSLDWDTGELTLSCASDEAWTQDVGLLTAAPQYAVAGATSTDLRTLVLNTFPLPYVNTQPSTTGMGANPTVVDPLWQPGQSWADYVTPAVEAAGAWLYCDEAAVFHLTAPSWVADATARTLTDAAHIKSVLETVSRDDPTWATSAVVSYTPKDTGATTFDAPISGGRESFGDRKSVV